MGFKEDIVEHLAATVRTSTDEVVKAVLRLVDASQGSVVLVDAFDDQTRQMLIGFKEKGAGQMARNFLKGGYGNILSAVQRHQSVSPAVSITIRAADDGAVTVKTNIETYSHMEGMFHNDLIGRDPHRRFLTDLGVALKQLDPRASVSIGS